MQDDLAKLSFSNNQYDFLNIYRTLIIEKSQKIKILHLITKDTTKF